MIFQSTKFRAITISMYSCYCGVRFELEGGTLPHNLSSFHPKPMPPWSKKRFYQCQTFGLEVEPNIRSLPIIGYPGSKQTSKSVHINLDLLMDSRFHLDHTRSLLLDKLLSKKYLRFQDKTHRKGLILSFGKAKPYRISYS